jgi:hypothetical protein
VFARTWPCHASRQPFDCEPRWVPISAGPAEARQQTRSYGGGAPVFTAMKAYSAARTAESATAITATLTTSDQLHPERCISHHHRQDSSRSLDLEPVRRRRPWSCRGSVIRNGPPAGGRPAGRRPLGKNARVRNLSLSSSRFSDLDHGAVDNPIAWARARPRAWRRWVAPRPRGRNGRRCPAGDSGPPAPQRGVRGRTDRWQRMRL